MDLLSIYLPWVRAAWRWLLFCFVLVLAVLIIFGVKEKDFAIRMAGLLFQLTGFVVASLDVYSLKKRFGIPALKTRGMNWLKNSPLFYKPVVEAHVSPARMHVSAGSTVIRTADGESLNLEERISRIEKKINKEIPALEEKLSSLWNKLDEKINNIDKHCHEIDSKQLETGKLLKSLFVDDVLSSEVAIVLFVVGSIMCTISAELLSAFG